MDLPEYQNHICFISRENVAELLGVLHPGIAASHLHAVVTNEMREKSGYMEQVCRQHGIKYTSYILPEMNIHAIPQLLDGIYSQGPAESWAVNITGGTKIMALAAYSWAMGKGIPAFYVDTAAQNILFYENSEWQGIRLLPVLNWQQLLNVYGYTISDSKKGPIQASVRQAISRLLSLADKKRAYEAFRLLNAVATKAVLDEPIPVYSPSPIVAELLHICHQAGKLEYGAKRIVFRDEPGRSWCKGIWLEEYVQSILAGLEGEGEIQSWATTVKVSHGNISNELDAVFGVANKLHIIECKTSRQDNSKQAADVLYKADSLKSHLGGVFAKSMICSLEDLSTTAWERAQSQRIKVVTGANLKNLRKIIMEWIQA